MHQERTPGVAAAAAQKRIGYQTKSSSATGADYMMREETETPTQIKESFESFLRNQISERIII
jgi:hypothetical protein